MKEISILLLLAFFILNVNAQSSHVKSDSSFFLLNSVDSFTRFTNSTANLKYFSKGFDLVSYHTEDGPQKGDDQYVAKYNCIRFKFVSQENLDLFHGDPEKYIPKYGSWCAYGMALSGKHYGANPRAFNIIDGNLYLFYRKSIFNYLKKWLASDPQKLIIQGDRNWQKEQG